MDIGVIDLFNGLADFVKIGSPFSFVITKDSVKIIESNSLPLGILDEMKPTVCSCNLSSGDVIVFLSDGITDSFGSSTDLINFLSTQRALNPKTLADNILEKALFLSNGKALDDMTAFCIRIFKKSA
jgi:stage II sporulation protein E